MARSAPQSAHRYPLTTILGSDAHVRILRELFRYGGQLSAPALVARSGLAKASVWAGLLSLEQTGVVSVAGSGRVRLYGIRSDHPLRDVLASLFEAEERRFDAMLEAVRSAARGGEHDVAAVWVYGSTARGEDRPGSDLDVVVVARRAAEKVAESTRHALRSAADRLGFVPSVTAITPADAVRLAKARHPWWADVARDAIVLLGARPEALARSHRGARPRRAAA